MLQVDALCAGYGGAQVLRGVSLQVRPGTVVAVVGRNGSGRSTMMKAIAGVVRPLSGSARLFGHELVGIRVDRIAQAGLAYVPEDREIFANLTVGENLRLGVQRVRAGHAAWTMARVWSTFPRLQERRDVKAAFLSGGEQQMLAICRALLGNPRAILVDEPTEGMAPRIVDQVRELILTLRAEGMAVVLVEQKLTFALDVSDEVHVMGHGTIVFAGSPDAFRANAAIRRQWLEV